MINNCSHLDLKTVSKSDQIRDFYLMIFYLLNFFINCDQNTKLTNLNYKTFRKLIENRTSSITWAVLFHDETNSKSQKIYTNFMKASTLSGGIIKFGIVDVKKQVQLTEDCNIRNVPKILIYHKDGITEYIGKIKPQKMVFTLYNYVPDLAKNVDETWIQSIHLVPAAIYFSNNSTIPSFWSAIAGQFSKSNINIGFSNNNTIFDLFDIGDVPVIMFFNDTSSIIYDGAMNFSQIKEKISLFLSKKLINNNNNKETHFLFSDEFNKECLESRSYCIVHAIDDINKNYEKIYKNNINLPIKWFYSEEDWPLEFIKPNSLWIINPRNNKALKINKINELEQIIIDLSNSKYKWKTFEELNKEL